MSPGRWIGTGLALLALTACGSPEADRERGGDAGADPGNRARLVEMHRGAEPYHDTPCLTGVECTGPMPTRTAAEIERGSRR